MCCHDVVYICLRLRTHCFALFLFLSVFVMKTLPVHIALFSFPVRFVDENAVCFCLIRSEHDMHLHCSSKMVTWKNCQKGANRKFEGHCSQQPIEGYVKCFKCLCFRHSHWKWVIFNSSVFVSFFKKLCFCSVNARPKQIFSFALCFHMKAKQWERGNSD